MNNPKSEIPNPESFDRQIEAAFRRLEALEQQVRETGEVSPEASRTLRLELLAELVIALEELRVAGEELQAQNLALTSAQQALETERQHYRDLFEFAPDGYLVTDAEGMIQEANDAMAALLNREQKFLEGRPLVLYVARADRRTFHTHLTRLQEVAIDRPEGWELSIQPYRRSPFPADLTVAPIVDSEGKLVTLRWLIRDITKRKQAETALQVDRDELERRVVERTAELRQERDFISAVLDTAGALVSILDTQGRIVRVNRACEQLTGYTHDELQGKEAWDVLLLPEETRPVKSVFEQLRAGNFPNKYENHLVTKEGDRRLIAWSNTILLDAEGEVEYIISTGIDITERRAMEQTLRENEARLDGIISTATDAIISIDANQRIILFNATAEQVFQYQAEAVIGQPLDLLLPERFRAGHAGHVQHFGRTGVTARRMGIMPDELWGRRAGGEEFPIEAMISQVKVGREHLYTVILRDISQRKQLEEALITHGRVLDNMAEGVVVADEDNIIFLTNPAFDAMFGYEPGELSGQSASVLNLDPAGTAVRFTTDIIPALQAGGVWSGEFNNRKKDGSPFITAAGISRLEMPDRTFLVSVQEDITERKLMELEQAQLFEEVSTQREQLRALTARLVETQEAERKAIARELHDQMGQNLTALDLNLSVIQRQIAEASPQVSESIQSYLDDSLALVEHVGSGIRDIMANLRPPILDDYGLVAALHWYGSQMAPRVDFTIKVQGDEPVPRLASSVELALFRIAQEALTNVTRHAQASRATVSLETDNGIVRLVIADDGLGFKFDDSKTFTDRQSWGLITMAERAEAVGGKFRLESQPGRGTQVIVEVRQSRRGEA